MTPTAAPDPLLIAVQALAALWPLGLLVVVFVVLRSSRGLSGFGARFFPPALLTWAAFALPRLGLTLFDARPFSFLPAWADHALFVAAGVALSLAGGWAPLKRALLARRQLADLQQVGQLHKISPAAFEQLTAQFFRQQGGVVRHVGRSGDHGVDLVVYTPRQGKWIVQCKRYRGSVGEPVVRDLFGAMHHEHASRAYLITSGVFTPQALAWARGKPLVLIDGRQFVRLARGLKR